MLVRNAKASYYHSGPTLTSWHRLRRRALQGTAKWLLAVDPVAHPEATSAWFYFFLCGVIGILMAPGFVYITQ